MSENMKFKDWAPIVISLFSFASAVTALYFTVFRQIDDLRIVFYPEPPAIRRDDSGKFRFDRGDVFTFLNAGTRTAAVVRAFLVIQQTKASDPATARTSCENTDIGYFYKFDAFALKAGEITTKFIELEKYGHLNVNGGTELLTVCIRFVSISPDSAEIAKDIPIVTQNAKTLDVVWQPTWKPPIPILQGRRWWP